MDALLIENLYMKHVKCVLQALLNRIYVIFNFLFEICKTLEFSSFTAFLMFRR